MAQKPDGKPAKVERVVFTRPAAERISKVVRTVELGNRDLGPLEFGTGVSSTPKVFRLATFTGSWAINEAKVVTFKNQTTTPNTLSATNLFFPNASATAEGLDCAVAKDGTAWYLISAPLATAQTSVITGVSLSTAGLQFTTLSIRFTETISTGVITISTTACTA